MTEIDVYKKNYNLIKKSDIPNTIKLENYYKNKYNDITEDLIFHRDLLNTGLNELYKTEIECRLSMDPKIAKYLIENYNTKNATIKLILLYNDFYNNRNDKKILMNCLNEIGLKEPLPSGIDEIQDLCILIDVVMKRRIADYIQ